MLFSTINKFAMRLPRIATRPIRTILRWQICVTIALAVVAGAWAGGHGAVSALLGGLVVIAAGFVSALMISGRRVKSAGETLRTLVRAEAGKIALIVLQLWLVLTTYQEVVMGCFFASFVVVILVFPFALLVRD
jgi:ATP synthase protein I